MHHEIVTTTFHDEHGPIEPQVFEALQCIRPSASRQARHFCIDEGTSSSLLYKAAALISKSDDFTHQRIRNLPNYLLTTYCQLLRQQTRKERTRSAILENHRDELQGQQNQHVTIYTDVLLQQIIDFFAREADDEDYRLILHYLCGYTYPELGDIFNLNQNAVRMRINRAVERARKALHPLSW